MEDVLSHSSWHPQSLRDSPLEGAGGWQLVWVLAIVVIGGGRLYGQVDSVEATTYVERVPYEDVGQLLKGKVAGLDVRATSGNVGGAAQYVVRTGGSLGGGGRPTFYVDGVRIEAEPYRGLNVGGQQVSALSMLSPDDIAEIEVLKGPASTALYGLAGANGVIRITTRSGGGGAAPVQVRFRNSFGQNRQHTPYDASNAAHPELLNGLFRDGAISEQALDVAGGTAGGMRYFTSYSRRLSQGTLRGSRLHRQTVRANVSADLHPRLAFDLRAQYGTSDVNRPWNDNSIFGPLGGALLSRTIFGFTDSLGVESTEDASAIARFIGSVAVRSTPRPGLELNALAGFDGYDTRNQQTFPADFDYLGIRRGQRSVYTSRNQQFNLRFDARYAYTVATDWQMETLIGSDAFSQQFSSLVLVRDQFQSGLLTNAGSGAGFFVGNEGGRHRRQAGLFVQHRADYRGLATLDVGLRRDYATALGEDVRAVHYPNARLGFRLDPWLPAFASMVRLHAGYGVAGQLAPLLNADRLRWTTIATGYGIGVVVDFAGNVDLEPERIAETEIGLEAELWRSRVEAELTWYRRRLTQSVVGIVPAPSTGFATTLVPANVGELKGHGVELQLRLRQFEVRGIGVEVEAWMSRQTSTVVSLGPAPDVFGGFQVGVLRPGLPRLAFYTSTSTGIYQEDGSLRAIVATERDAQTGEPQPEFLGKPFPTYTGALGLTLDLYPGLDLYLLADWALDQQIFNRNHKIQSFFGSDRARRRSSIVIGFVEPQNEYPDLVVAEPGSPDYVTAAEYFASTDDRFDGNFVESADFFKLREISLRYDITDGLRLLDLDRFVRRAQFALSGRNLLTLSPYSGVDPEVNWAGADNLTWGQDFMTHPHPRSWYATVSFDF